ncbi:alpha 1,2-mannosyltransferase 2.4.1 [Apophysomyces sp. BC1034]|nr:alpha 1,2-mannosyltransferase 2.4.1 [Apophysomyces sp. BC1021]KAG0189876.1 alpha 1,2-mannosyltransferase 2.4.1 [Apophysomyces sp. BC1034]
MDWPPNSSYLTVKAAFVVLVREADLFSLRETMRTIEDRFNKQRGYPWIILSDQPFSSHFQEWIQSVTLHPVYFGQAPAEEWHEPNWIDMKRAEAEAIKMYADEVYHDTMLPFSHTIHC